MYIVVLASVEPLRDAALESIKEPHIVHYRLENLSLSAKSEGVQCRLPGGS